MPPSPEPRKLDQMTPESIIAAFRRGGGLSYDGEGVTQLQHAWQCGRLAAQAGAAPALQLAAWLHDLGHLLTDLEGSPTLRGIDDGHEALAAAALQPLFGEAVTGPIALHVAAKRYLVAARSGYRDSLSPDSVRSLALQGGPMAADQQEWFRRQPHADDALRLRAWDDAGKRADWHPADDESALCELAALLDAAGAAAGPPGPATSA